MTLKLRVDIGIEIEAVDFIEAAEHQRAMQAFMETLHAEYPQALMTIKERRGARLAPPKRPERPQRSSLVRQYADRRRETP